MKHWRTAHSLSGEAWTPWSQGQGCAAGYRMELYMGKHTMQVCTEVPEPGNTVRLWFHIKAFSKHPVTSSICPKSWIKAIWGNDADPGNGSDMRKRYHMPCKEIILSGNRQQKPNNTHKNWNRQNIIYFLGKGNFHECLEGFIYFPRPTTAIFHMSQTEIISHITLLWSLQILAKLIWGWTFP